MPTATLPGVRRVEHIMGMPIVVDVRDEGVDEVVLERVFDWLRFVDETFSTYKESSEISRLNQGELTLAHAHPDVREVLVRCEELRCETDGYFDVRAASANALDPSGLVKGWSVDRAAGILDEEGLTDYAVSAGGDMRLRGRAVPESCWRVGIQHPLERDRVAAVVEASDCAVATSGAYERGEHVFDPYSGLPPTEVLSVTVVGPDLGTADAYATAAFAMGSRGPHWTARLCGYEAMTIMADETVFSTASFPAVSLVTLSARGGAAARRARPALPGTRGPRARRSL
jgi:thiamine biosynthesis lipoprotein